MLSNLIYSKVFFKKSNEISTRIKKSLISIPKIPIKIDNIEENNKLTKLSEGMEKLLHALSEG